WSVREKSRVTGGPDALWFVDWTTAVSGYGATPLGWRASRNARAALFGSGELSTLSTLVDFFFQAEDGIRVRNVTGVQTCALPIFSRGLGPGEEGQRVPIASTRAGHIPGTHRVGFDSAADQILLVHTARPRAGFAAGALQIGRASCRERVEVGVGAGAVKKKGDAQG